MTSPATPSEDERPSGELRIRLAEAGFQAFAQTRGALWAFLAERWHTCAGMPDTISTDQLARTVLSVTEGRIEGEDSPLPPGTHAH